MSRLSRRDFISLGTAALATSGAAARFAVGAATDILEHPRATIEALERSRVLRASREYLHEPPQTIVSAPAPRSAGGLHDYFSEADYFWPNPKDPNGPYINRDGESNPANFNTHRLLLIRLSIQMPALAAAWLLTKRKEFAEHSAAHLRAWFIEPETRMNPNLQYAQAVHGVTTGRSWGIIDTLHLVEVARSTIVLHDGGALSEPDWQGVQDWFADYLKWMQTSDPGQKERDAKNNHGSCWLLQAAEFAILAGKDDALLEFRDRFKNTLIPAQVATDGSLPLELARTKPYGYSLFNLDALGMLAQMLSTSTDKLWEFTLPDGRGLAACFRFMAPFIANKTSWPYRRDVQYFEDLPVRQPSLLFAGLAYRNARYLDLWKRLDPDPQVPEVIRNHPIRQPVLWFS
jgi:hypothetical protein